MAETRSSGQQCNHKMQTFGVFAQWEESFTLQNFDIWTLRMQFPYFYTFWNKFTHLQLDFHAIMTFWLLSVKKGFD